MHDFNVWGLRYQVKDVQRSINFYTQQLGFKLEHQQGTVFAKVKIDSLDLFLSGPGSSGARPMPDGSEQQPGGWNRLVLQVKDLPASIEEMKKTGVQFRNNMEVGPAGKQIQIE